MKRYIDFDVNGETYKLRFDFNSMAEIETKSGKGINQIFDEANVGFATIRLLYWGGMVWRKQQNFTLHKVGEILSDKLAEGGTLEDLLNPIMEAMKVAGLIQQSNEENEEADGTAKN